MKCLLRNSTHALVFTKRDNYVVKKTPGHSCCLKSKYQMAMCHSLIIMQLNHLITFSCT